MPEALVTPFLEHERLCSPFPRVTHARPRAGSSSKGVATVEIVAPDRYCADLLADLAAPSFRAEIVSGLSWLVRLHLPPTGGGWVSEFLSLVERWLESVPLPCAKVLYDGRSYLARSSIEPTQPYESTARSGPRTSSLTQVLTMTSADHGPVQGGTEC